MREKIPRLMGIAGIPGLSLAIVRDGNIVLAEGFGLKRVATDDPVSTDTVFEGASFSKPIFAYAVLKLCERGVFDLDTPLTEFIPEPYVPDDDRLHLSTARHVLGHTSGLPNFRSKEDGSLNIEFKTGERFGYSTEGYRYLQLAVERIVQRSLNDYMRENLLIPLGMHNSSYVWMESYDRDVGFGHDRKGEASSFRREHKEANAGITLHTNPLDFSRFLIEMMQDDDGDDYRLSKVGRQKMLTPHVDISKDLSWGLGWGIEQTDRGPAFWHWGDTGTYKNFTVGFRERREGVVIMTNSANGLKVCEDIVNAAIGCERLAFSFSMLDV